jgi:hypothetical protein
MKKLDKTACSQVKSWLYRNARPVELALWRYYFENGGKDAVLEALSAYQNGDGGFGNALEPDSWNPASSPYATLYAINVLKRVAFHDTSAPMVKGIFRFLEEGGYFSKDGWPFTIPSNDDHAHAPWWGYNPEANAYESQGLSAELACFALRFAHVGDSLYQSALSICDGLMEKLKEPDNKFGEMGLGGYCVMLETIQKLGLKNRFDYAYLSKTLGAKITVPTVDGDEALDIPAGTQSGKVFRLKGKGAPRVRSDGGSSSRGDQLIVLQVVVPTKLTNEQKRLFEELGRTLGGADVEPQKSGKGFFDRVLDFLGGETT